MLVENADLRALFDALCAKTKEVKRVSSLVLNQLIGFLNAREKTIAEAPSIDDLSALLRAIVSGEISNNAAKDVLEEMIDTGKKPADIIAAKGLTQISDESALEEIVKRAIAANPDAVASYKNGKESALGAVVGWMMKETKGQANPAKSNEILRRLLA